MGSGGRRGGDAVLLTAGGVRMRRHGLSRRTYENRFFFEFIRAFWPILP